MTDRPSGSEMIEAERRRQVEKWTPGPWMVLCGKSGRPRAVCVPGGAGIVSWNGIARPASDGKANAHLIAAAPTLYDVLNRLSLHGKGEGGAKDTEIAAALRLARGETP